MSIALGDLHTNHYQRMLAEPKNVFRVGTSKINDSFSYEQSCRETDCGKMHKVCINGVSGVVDHEFIANYCRTNGIPVPLHFECNYEHKHANNETNRIIEKMLNDYVRNRSTMNEYGDIYGDRIEIYVEHDKQFSDQYVCFVNGSIAVLRQDVVAKWFLDHKVEIPTPLISTQLSFHSRGKPCDLTSYKGKKDTLYIVDIRELPTKKKVSCAINDEYWVDRNNLWLCQWFKENELEFLPQLDKDEVPDVEYHDRIFTGSSGSTLWISPWCLESYPCQHDCIQNDEHVRLNGVKILDWFKKEGLVVPNHFRGYANRPKAWC